MGFSLFVTLIYLSLALAGANDINWISVLYFPDQGNLSSVGGRDMNYSL